MFAEEVECLRVELKEEDFDVQSCFRGSVGESAVVRFSFDIAGDYLLKEIVREHVHFWLQH